MKNFLNKNFARTGTLLKFAFRRERIVSVIWILSVVITVAIVAPVFEGVLADNQPLIEMLQTPAMVAMMGPVFDTAPGAIFAAMMLLFVAIAAAVMNIFFILRHTRADEERGRAEVLRSLPIGRLSSLAAALTGALIINIVLAILLFASLAFLPFDGFGISGAIVFALSVGLGGFIFAALSAVFSQFFQNTRTASASAFGLLTVFYLMRMVGDAAVPMLSFFSPLGLVLRAQAFAGNIIWPLVILFVLSLIFMCAALWLNVIRDIDQGIIPSRKGRQRAGGLLKNSFGLSFKLVRTMLISFAVGIFLLGATYGAVMGQMEDFIANNEMLSQMFGDAEGFVTMIIMVMGVLACVPVMLVQKRLVAEEKAGRLEGIFSAPISRVRMFCGYYIIAAASAVFMLFIGFIGLWAASAAVLDVPPSFVLLFGQVMVYLPAVLLMAGLAGLLVGVLPDKGYIAWIYLGFSLFISYIGSMLQMPSWMQFLTPFGYVSDILHVGNVAVAARLTGLSAVAVGLAAIGLVAYKKRDIKNI